MVLSQRKLLCWKQPGLILPQAHFQPRVGAGSTPRARLAPSIVSPPRPKRFITSEGLRAPRRGAQLLAHISSHLIPPRERGALGGSLAKPRLASGLPFPAEARPRWVKQMWQQMRKSSAPRGSGGGGRAAKKEPGGTGRRETRFLAQG